MLKIEDNAFDLKTRMSKVEQEAQMQARGFEVIQALRTMDFVNPFHDF